MKISYCSTCKNRMSQLSRTLHVNLATLSKIDAEWIILDYYSEDGFSDILMNNSMARELMRQGKLKIYRLEHDIPFAMSLAKNLAHHYATGDFVFNLDIDNYIGDSFSQIQALKENEFIWAINHSNLSGACGRLGVRRDVFLTLGGYDLDLCNVGYDDINLAKRLEKHGLKCRIERNVIPPVPNTREATAEFTKSTLTVAEQYKQSKQVHDRKIARTAFANPQGNTLYNNFDVTKVTTLLIAE